MGTAILCQHFIAPNDVNGNPRRLWVGYTKEGAVEIIDKEDYEGKPKWASNCPQVVICPHISPTEYNSILKYYKHKEITNA